MIEARHLEVVFGLVQEIARRLLENKMVYLVMLMFLLVETQPKLLLLVIDLEL